MTLSPSCLRLWIFSIPYWDSLALRSFISNLFRHGA